MQAVCNSSKLPVSHNLSEAFFFPHWRLWSRNAVLEGGEVQTWVQKDYIAYEWSAAAPRVTRSTMLSRFSGSRPEDASPSTSGRSSPPQPSSGKFWRRPPSLRHRSTHTCRGQRDEVFGLWREELPRPDKYVGRVVPGHRTVATPLLTPDKVATIPYPAGWPAPHTGWL